MCHIRLFMLEWLVCGSARRSLGRTGVSQEWYKDLT